MFEVKNVYKTSTAAYIKIFSNHQRLLEVMNTHRAENRRPVYCYGPLLDQRQTSSVLRYIEGILAHFMEAVPAFEGTSDEGLFAWVTSCYSQNRMRLDHIQ